MLHRTQVSKDVKSSVFAAEDLLEVITHGHVLAAAMTVKSVTKLEDMSLTVSEKLTSLSERIRRCDMSKPEVAEHITPRFYMFSYPFLLLQKLGEANSLQDNKLL